MNLKTQLQKDSQDKTKTQELQSHTIALHELLQKLSERLNHLEERILSLEKPQLMYKRPSAEEHESISDTLNYLHNTVEELKQCQEQ